MDLKNYIRTQRPVSSEANRPLHVLFASCEVAPFSKTGGLGDVAAALPQALARLGHHVTVLTPLYKHIDPARLSLSRRLLPLEIPRQGINRHKVEAHILEGRMEGGVRVLFLDAPGFFDRTGLYGYDADQYTDNAARFALFSRAIVEVAKLAPVAFDVVHCHDWHTALAPLYARHYYQRELDDTAFILTIHNLAYQGRFDQDQFASTGLPKKYQSDAYLLQDGQLNFLKAGILMADAITTVSATYAQEIQTEAYGCGLEPTLREVAAEGLLSGILNGADYNIWSPARDREIPVRYSEETLNGKRQNKAALQHLFALPIRPTLPLLGFVGRLTEQKGLDLLLPVLEQLLSQMQHEREGFQVVFLGEGDVSYKTRLEALAAKYPRRVGVKLRYEEAVAHQIQAGADILLVPSRFEPCGLTQIYALRYGTLPLVHATGGLADTVIDADADPEQGTGFSFKPYTQEALRDALDRAIEHSRHYRRWRPLMIRAMAKDFSWEESARQYDQLYRVHMGADELDDQHAS